MPTIYDNINNHLTIGLNDTLEVSLRTDFCVGYFNLRGWKEVAEKIDSLQGSEVREGNQNVHRVCRLLVGMQKLPIDMLREYFSSGDDNMVDQAEAIKLKKKLAQEFKDQLAVGAPTDLDESALRKLSNQLKKNKVTVKLHLRYMLHAKLYIVYSQDKRVPVVGYLGSSNLTLAGLAKQGELNIDVMDQDAAVKLANWFDDRWNDRWCIDITKELIEVIDQSWATEKPISPYHIYLKIAYHLSSEARAGINEFKLSKEFQRELLDFQQKAVLVAAHHLHKRGGVMVGDVVGLGKTITATALARIFEDDFYWETLIICPKNLTEMWMHYRDKHLHRARVVSLSKVQTVLPKLKRYRLVIIDESQNLRNDRGARYRAIKSYLEANDSKVILLTATPYNKSYLDLSNQLRLFIADDKDLGISPERYLEKIGGQVQFASRHTETYIRSIKAFEKSAYADDWRELMRLFLVRRTRSFIQNNYAKTDDFNGRKYLTFSDGTKSYFPDRIPKRVLYEFDPHEESDIYANLYSQDIVDIVNSLELPRYGLQQYLREQPNLMPTIDEQKLMKNLSRAGKRLMGFCRTNLFKRLESSGFSFLLSLSRHILRNYLFVYALNNKLPVPIGKKITQNLDDYLEDGDTDNDGESTNQLKLILKEESYLEKAKEVYELFLTDKYKNRFDWIRSDFFSDSLMSDLIKDSKAIIKVLNVGKNWNPDDDKQLNALYSLLMKKHNNEKVLVFTQYADTAYYLTEHLKKRGVSKIEFVSGDVKNPTEYAYRFSPYSNEQSNIFSSEKEIRVLISTDILSEGQNLQDAHIIVNYDLPWAIIRLIQRAGRVDRIGQKSEQILCYSFLPEDGIEQIIKLRGRLKQRIKQNAEVVGSDETFFDGDPVNLSDIYSETSGILDGEDDDTEVDLASLAYQIWKNAIDVQPELNKIIPDLPNVIYSTKQNNEAIDKEGVIVYTRTSEDNDVLTLVGKNGNVITQSQHTILKAAQCTPDTTPKMKIENHHDLVKKALNYIREEEKGIGGTLGKKTGVKYLVYTRLDRYCKENEGTLFVNEQLKKAIDDVFKYTLKEYAKETLSRQMKAGISDSHLGNLVISLREEDKLVIVNEDDQTTKEPQIICSLGLKN